MGNAAGERGRTWTRYWLLCDVETRSHSYFNGLDRLEPRWPEIHSEVDECPYIAFGIGGRQHKRRKFNTWNHYYYSLHEINAEPFSPSHDDSNGADRAFDVLRQLGVCAQWSARRRSFAVFIHIVSNGARRSCITYSSATKDSDAFCGGWCCCCYGDDNMKTQCRIWGAVTWSNILHVNIADRSNGIRSTFA